MNAASARALVTRLLAKGGSPVPWTRRELDKNGPAGTVTVIGTPVTVDVQAAQLTERSASMFQSQAWQTASVRLVVGSSTFPFGEPSFDDIVGFLGTDYRVVAIETWSAPNQTTAALPACWFVGLGA